MFSLGMGGLSEPLPKLLKGMKWELEKIPFFFKIINPYSFLKNIKYFRSTKLKSIFGSALDSSKKKDYRPGSALKHFKAYVFGLRSGTVEQATPGWQPTDEENLDFLGELFAAEVSIIDALATE